MASVGWVVDPDDHNKLVPLGAVGELLIEGPILARGYLNDTQRTAAAFIHDPAWLVRGSLGCSGQRGRLYKTGDLVYYRPDGNLVYVGRKDSQVKVRGQRVELGEIEHHLHQCMPDVTQLAVEVVVPAGGKTMAAAFLETRLDGRTSHGSSDVDVVFPALVDGELAQRVPSDMLPEVNFAVAELHITTSTKIDRQRLRDIGASFLAQQLAALRTECDKRPKRRPATRLETTMQQLWAQVLGIDAAWIGLDDSFFRLGGDSIAAMALVGQARRSGIPISVADVFRSRTLSRLLAAVSVVPDGSSAATATWFRNLFTYWIIFQSIKTAK